MHENAGFTGETTQQQRYYLSFRWSLFSCSGLL